MGVINIYQQLMTRLLQLCPLVYGLMSMLHYFNGYHIPPHELLMTYVQSNYTTWLLIINSV